MNRFDLRAPVAAAVFSAAVFCLPQAPLDLTILHTNDLHAHPEATIMGGKPYGGYARQATLIKQIRSQRPNTLLLNAGDCFQGTLYFNTYEGLVECVFMNAVGYDAMCAGNHEFDRGPEVFANFIRHATFPVLGANIDASADPALRGLVVPYTILQVQQQKIGVVGLVTPDTPNISSPGPTVKILSLLPAAQRAVNELQGLGVDKVFLLTHIGYAEDQALARQLTGVDVIVGGHSHSPLGTPALTGWPAARGPYPTVVQDRDGKDVYVVQGYEWGKLLGNFRVKFDEKGFVTEVSDAKPIVIDESIPEDPSVSAMIAAFRKPIEALSNQKLGSSEIEITRNASAESLMANVVADAMLAATSKYGATVAFMNSGGVRGGFDQGDVTYGEAIAVQPFGNTLVVVQMSGAQLLAVLNDGARGPDKIGGLLHPSKGSAYRLDYSKPFGARVFDVMISGHPIRLDAQYGVAFNSFNADGGDEHSTLKGITSRNDTGIADIEALVDYIAKNSPLRPQLEGRIRLP